MIDSFEGVSTDINLKSIISTTRIRYSDNRRVQGHEERVRKSRQPVPLE